MTVTLVVVWLIVPLDVVALTFWNPGGIVSSTEPSLYRLTFL